MILSATVKTCMDAQADLGLRCLYMPKDTFLHGIAWLTQLLIIKITRPRGYKTFFNSAEHEICPANKIQITNFSKFFLAKHS